MVAFKEKNFGVEWGRGMHYFLKFYYFDKKKRKIKGVIHESNKTVSKQWVNITEEYKTYMKKRWTILRHTKEDLNK